MANAEGQHMSKQQFAETMTTIRTGKDSAIRTDAAQHLFELTRGKGSKQLDDKSIAEIASLLDGSKDSVRYWVARCLGNFGPRAKMAVPRLTSLLQEVDCLKGDKTSASGIRFALTQIGVTPPPEPICNTVKQ
jgi:hypothetical protein